MRNFFVITNAQKDKEYCLTGQIRDYITTKGGKCSFVKGMWEEENYAGEIPDDTQCILVLGGDGTLIRAARTASRRNIPLIGVNLGHLGYLCELEESSLFFALDEMMQDHYMIEERMMLRGGIFSGPVKSEKSTALNDIVITRKGALQLVELIVYVNGEYLNTYHADGIIAATPTGSTGYSLSAGGPIVDPRAQLILITPVNAHNLNAKSIVISAEDEIVIEVGTRRSGKDERVEVHFDGTNAMELGVGDKIEIAAAEQNTKILKLSKRSFLEILRKKMQSYS